MEIFLEKIRVHQAVYKYAPGDSGDGFASSGLW